MPTKITFYGGVKEVGGNKVLLDDNGPRIVLDFGKGFSRRAKFFEECLKPRSANGLVDFIEMDFIPDVEKGKIVRPVESEYRTYLNRCMY